MKRTAAIESGRLALSLPATDLLASDIAGELEMSAMRVGAGEPTISFPPARFFAFDHHRHLCIDDAVLESRKYVKCRAWHFDFAWPGMMVAAEVEPASTIARSAALYRNELEKYNTAALLGWRVFRFTPQDVRQGRAMEMLRLALSPAPPNRNQGTDADGIQSGTNNSARPPLPVDH